MNTDWSAENSVWARHSELCTELAMEACEWAKMAKRQRKLVESYTERRRYPKRLNRNPGHHEQQRTTEA